MSIDWTIKATDISIVFATLVGPILAIWASEWRQKNRQNQERKEWVFRTLMTTRSARLHPDHIQALNHIVFAFSNQPEIVDAWGLYFEHLKTTQTQENQAHWQDKANTLLAKLIHLMAKDLNIPFSETDITQPSYYPRLYELTESEQLELRKLLLEVLRNERSINMNATVFTPPQS
ncbi:MAG TPA: hypothetical protein PL133_08675 [Methylophilaceae bacterium]|nr:hypothetical protein [Methylophilaceae bacterium]HQC29465.1 hypothetical protein [Methylotenera sp.]